MDLNHLLYQHQRAMMRSRDAAGVLNPGAFGLVRHYQTRIDRFQALMGVSSRPAWCTPIGAAS
ncbi:hypothetical protein H7F50_12540 [Novosphingobium flavum]|uniref:Uncharacterized protein n=1 Tax=Novosphingobium aerophilum TaxID=2839843 RepID=A0A7X1F8Y3_9SPHN|nr:hypothetical protein [Novosphingobium aerophilum]MBC2652546.1 hypothetical protein [Novosphingobium aerophilum]MBC2662582.1 hypothetical protein [Novosphingobium aerophilum]